MGIGGIFFKTTDVAKTREWYATHLGLADKGQGVMLPWRQHDDPQKEHLTVWSAFPANTDYFAPGKAEFMVNYIVDDLDAMLERLQRGRATVHTAGSRPGHSTGSPYEGIGPRWHPAPHPEPGWSCQCPPRRPPGPPDRGRRSRPPTPRAERRAPATGRRPGGLIGTKR